MQAWIMAARIPTQTNNNNNNNNYSVIDADTSSTSTTSSASTRVFLLDCFLSNNVSKKVLCASKSDVGENSSTKLSNNNNTNNIRDEDENDENNNVDVVGLDFFEIHTTAFTNLRLGSVVALVNVPVGSPQVILLIRIELSCFVSINVSILASLSAYRTSDRERH